MRGSLVVLVATLLLATSAQGLLLNEAEVDPMTEAPRQEATVDPAPASEEVGGEAQATQSEAKAPFQVPSPPSLMESLEQIKEDTGMDAWDRMAPMSLRLMAMQAQPNGTGNETGNGTAVTEENGTVTHHHGHTGDQGLNPVWATPFHGQAEFMLAYDIDGDGQLDAIAGSDLSITAVSGATGKLLWAHHIGSPVTSMFFADGVGDGTPEVGFSTAWTGVNPHVGLLDLKSGHLLWKKEGDSSFVTAGPMSTEGTTDIITVDTSGMQRVLAGDTGNIKREVAHFELPSVGAAVLYMYGFGHYLGGIGDFDGDGIMDTVTVQRYWAFSYLPTGSKDYEFALVSAMSGATGDMIWTHHVSGTPGDWTWFFPTAMEVLDANGDGTDDVAFAAYSMAYNRASVPFVPVPSARTYMTHLRVIDGSSNTVGEALALREVPGPNSALEYHWYLDHVQGEEGDDLIVMGSSAIPGAGRVARYAIDGPTSLLVPAATSNEYAQVLYGFETADGRKMMMVTFDDSTFEGVASIMGADLQPEATTRMSWNAPLAAADLGNGIALGTFSTISIRDSLDAADRATYHTRGAPDELGIIDHDGDGFLDILVASSDGAIYVIDGLNGAVLETIRVDGYVYSIESIDVTGDGRLDLVTAYLNGDGDLKTSLMDGRTKETLWTADGMPYRGLWFDAQGDGVLDYISDLDPNFDEIELEVTDGATGEVLWAKSVAVDGYMWPDVVQPVRFSNGGTDLFLMDSFDGIVAVGGANGTKLWSKTFENSDDYLWERCAGAADFDGDGVQQAIIITDSFFGNDAEAYAYDATGKRTKLSLGAPEDVSTCAIHTVKVGIREEILVTMADWDNGRMQLHMGRFGGLEDPAYIWKDKGKAPTEGFGYYNIFGVDPNTDRFSYAFQDHVYTATWSEGKYKAQFTVNGPFVEEGILVNLDKKGTHEVVVITGDGMLWGLAEDAPKVAQNLAKEADKQGKDSDIELDTTLDLPDTKKSPGPALFALLVAFAALAVLRRRQ